MRVAVVARGLHEHKAEHHHAVEQHGVRARKGKAGIMTQYVDGIEEIDGRAQKADGNHFIHGTVFSHYKLPLSLYMIFGLQ